MEAAGTSETSVNFYQTTRRYNPEDSHLHTNRRENLDPTNVHQFIIQLKEPFEFFTRLSQYCLETKPTPWSRFLLKKLIVLSTSQEITRLLWNTKAHYRVHRSRSSVHILSQMNPIHIPKSNFPKIRFNIIFPSTSRSYQCCPT
jgi:hypothetical protein